jgi:divalent metal cation (Fe/Co/Zn/Cd) transporter
VGLVLRAQLGWWWADPIAAIGIAALAAREGYEMYTTEDICC